MYLKRRLKHVASSYEHYTSTNGVSVPRRPASVYVLPGIMGLQTVWYFAFGCFKPCDLQCVLERVIFSACLCQTVCSSALFFHTRCISVCMFFQTVWSSLCVWFRPCDLHCVFDSDRVIVRVCLFQTVWSSVCVCFRPCDRRVCLFQTMRSSVCVCFRPCGIQFIIYC